MNADWRNDVLRAINPEFKDLSNEHLDKIREDYVENNGKNVKQILKNPNFKNSQKADNKKNNSNKPKI